MSKSKVLILIGLLLIASGLLFPLQSGVAVSPTATPAPVPTRVNLTPLPPTVSGTVSDSHGPLAGAIVQIQGRAAKTYTAGDGTFTLSGLSGTTPVTLIAWFAGHYEGWTTVNPSAPDWPGADKFKITLKTLPEKDNTAYDWFSFNGVKGSASCGLCHREYKEWQADAHSGAAQNQRFLTMYTGADVHGRPGQPTRYGNNGAALPPDASKPYYGPGLQLDTPDRAGNCAACHTPLASKVSNQQNCAWSGCHTSLTVERSRGVIPPVVNPLSLHGDAAEGITCDFCHKVGDVVMNPKTALPYPDMPGILSLRLYRPDEGQQVFFGTLVDVARRVSYSLLEGRSEFCAGCHYGVFGGVVGNGDVKGGTLVYNSYGEWLASPYSDPATGQTCQQCHMPVSSAKWFVFPEQGGLTRDYATLHNHQMPGALDQKFLQNAVSVRSDAQRAGSEIKVQVSITNDRTGHAVPTDSPIRSMILVVEALDSNGKALTLSQGPANPAFSGDFGGLPGKTFAKVLKDNWTGEAPTGAIWRPTTIIEDTRLAALATDTSAYTFSAPAGISVTVRVRLVYRRAFAALAAQKGWTDPDILMYSKTVPVPAR